MAITLPLIYATFFLVLNKNIRWLFGSAGMPVGDEQKSAQKMVTLKPLCEFACFFNSDIHSSDHNFDN